MTAGVKRTGVVVIGVHQVVEQAFTNSGRVVTETHHLSIVGIEFLLFRREMLHARSELLHTFHTPIVENRCPTVTAAEALHVHTALTEFLTGVNHKRIGVHAGTYHQSRQSTLCISSKEVGGDALLVVVLQEVEHVLVDIVCCQHPVMQAEEA